MPATALPANAELVTMDYLRANGEVLAVTNRIGSEVNAQRPCLRVQQITESEGAWGWFNSALLQFDAYAETQGQARLLIDTVRKGLRGMAGAYARGVVAGVTHERGPDWIPDPDLTNAQGKPMPRYSADFRIHLHPTP